MRSIPLRETLSKYKRRLSRLPKKIKLLLTQPARNKILNSYVRGKRVLILGAGPSVHDLTSIPDDVLVFACNITPSILIEKKLKPYAHIYVASRNAIEDYKGKIEPLMQQFNVDIFATRDLEYIRNRSDMKIYNTLILDRFGGDKSHYGARRLFGRNLPYNITGSSTRRSVSTGVALLLYALVYGAREIYLAGIDIPRSGSNYDRAHGDIDKNILTMASQKFSNIYCIPTHGEITGYFPCKELV